MGVRRTRVKAAIGLPLSRMAAVRRLVALEVFMRTRVEKCSGGLAVVVPEALAAQVGLRDGGPAELELAGGRLVVRPGGPATLAELLSGVTPQNLHVVWPPGPPAGAELL